MIVYSVTNKLNHKKYFCVTGDSSLKQSKWNHRHRAKTKMRRMKLKPTSRMGKSPFHIAYTKYGEKNFRYKVEYRISNRTDAFACKERLIAEFDTMNPEHGYNCTTGGNQSFKNAIHVIERLSVANTGKTMPDSFVKIMKERVGELHPAFGFKHSKETRETMRQGQLNSDYVPTEETRRKTSASAKKVWSDKEFKEKMIQKHKEIGRWKGKNNPMYGVSRKGKDNPMYGKRAWNRGIPMTEEQQKKIQEGREKYQVKRRIELLEKYKNITEKECKHCKEIKPLEMFWKSASNIDGYIGNCKICETGRKRNNRRKKKLKEPIND